MVFREVSFEGGRATLGFQNSTASAVQFLDCSFRGGRLELTDMANMRVEFIRCKLEGGELDLSLMQKASKVKFVDCVFTADVIKEIGNQGWGFGGLESTEVILRGCTFSEGAEPFESHGEPPWVKRLREREAASADLSAHN
ncbi:hypothetical protein RI444_18315 [Paenarthrobacter sp. AT5]|uniref:hypothetical protein n=1 Tax=Paenarthrobacter TaxID=1742992 RepID=UPI001A9832CC|nr:MULTISPECIES: hypothetical protein [Paenarthrobacter]QSZ52767.1 hypothetical protein AYX19_06990 [Paenarthrobacter ureafaciens]WOC60440.1 hypothetical protein RI444_18315 [Paenarthrobacter sp. AT5]